jgi:hypothetical protein
MSRKIYNEIVLQWNEVTKQYDTLYEDSYDYDGPLVLTADDELGGLDFDAINRGWEDVSKSFANSLKSQVKKASAIGTSDFKKAFVSVASNVNMLLKQAVEDKSIGETLGANIGNAMESALQGTADVGELRAFGEELTSIGDNADVLNQKFQDWASTWNEGATGAQMAFNEVAKYQEALEKDDGGMAAANVVNDMAQNLGISAQAAEHLMKHLVDVGSEQLLSKDSLDADGNVIQPLSEAFAKSASGFGEDLTMAAENLELQQMEKHLQDSVKGGVNSALNIIPDNAFTQALGLDKFKEQMGTAVSDSVVGQQVTKKMHGFSKKLGSIAKNHWGKVMGGALALGLGVMLISKIAEHTDQIGNKFGAIGVNEFQTDLMSANATAQSLGYDFEEIAGSVNELSNNFGVAFGEAIEISKSSMDTAKALGISTDQAAGLTGQLMLTSGLSAEGAQNFMKQAAGMAKAAGVAPGAIMEDMAGSSEEIASYTKGSGENMAAAAVKARSMGMSLGDAAKMADSLLDFSSSIEAEMTASAITGKNLNLQRARELSLAGDLAGMQEEVLKQVGSEAEFNEMNVLQRKAMADAMGVEVSQLQKMVSHAGKSNAELMKMSDVDVSQIVSKDAISQVTLITNQFKAAGTQLLAFVAGIANLGGIFGDLPAPMAAIIAGLVAIGTYMLFVTGRTLINAKVNKILARSIDDVATAEARKLAVQKKQKLKTPGGKGGFKMPKLPSASSMLKGAAAILVLSAALFVTAKAFQEFGSVEWSAVGKGLVGIVGLATIAVVLGAIGGPMLAGAFAIGVLSLALVPMAYAFSLIQDVGIGTMMGFAATLSVLAVAAAGLGIIAPFIIAGSTALLILSTSLIPTTYALSLLAGVDTGMLTSLSSILLSLGSSMALLGLMTPAILLGSYALMIMSGAFGIFGSAMVVMGTGLQMTMPFLTQLGTIMGQLLPQVEGINLLAGSLTNLAAGLFMVGAAGLLATPALKLLGSIGLFGGAIGEASKPPKKEGPTETEVLQLELAEIKGHLKTLVTGFGEAPSEADYLAGIGTKTAVAVGNTKLNVKIDKGLV